MKNAERTAAIVSAGSPSEPAIFATSDTIEKAERTARLVARKHAGLPRSENARFDGSRGAAAKCQTRRCVLSARENRARDTQESAQSNSPDPQALSLTTHAGLSGSTREAAV